MKRLLLILFTLVSLSTQAQYIKPSNPYGTISNRASIDSTLFIPTGCDTPSLRGVDLHKMALYGDTCNNILYKYNPKDSTWSEAGGVSRSTVDSLLGGYYTKTQVDSIITVINTSLDLKVNIADTSDMLSPYTPRSELSDTAAKKYSSATQIDSTSYSLNKVNGDKTVFVFDGGSEGGAATASNGLTKVGEDIQFGGTLTTDDTLNLGTNNLVFYSPDLTGSKNFRSIVGDYPNSKFSYIQQYNHILNISSVGTGLYSIAHMGLDTASIQMYHMGKNKEQKIFLDDSLLFSVSELNGSGAISQLVLTPSRFHIRFDNGDYRELTQSVNSTYADTTGNISITQLPVNSKSSDPTTTDIPEGFSAVYTNTTSGLTYLWANIGGTLLKTELN